MKDTERIEKAQAEREARDAAVRRTSHGPVSQAVQAAMAKYLAEEYQGHAAESTDETPDPGDE